MELLRPQGCPFEPTVDLYGEHEKKKQRNRASQGSGTWTCGICGKSFKNEHYLDLHLERRHMEELGRGGNLGRKRDPRAVSIHLSSLIVAWL